MNRLCRLLILAIAALLLTSSPASAQDALAPAPGAQHAPGDSISYSTWAIDGPVIRLQVSLPTAEAAKLAGPRAPVPDASAVSDAVAAAFAARSASGPCTVVDQGEGEGTIYRLALTPGLYRFEVIFRCASTKGMTLSDNLLFDRVPGHIDLARVQVGSAPPFVEMFTRSHRKSSVQAQGGAGVVAFVRQGASNMARHADWLCLLVGIVLFCTRRRDLAFVAGGIAVGQVAAATMAVEGLAIAWPMLTGATTGLFVAGLGAAALRFRTRDEPRPARGWRIAVGFSLAVAVAGAIFAAHQRGPAPGWSVAGACIACLAILAGARTAVRPHWLVWFPALLLGLLSGMTIGTNLAFLAMPPARFLTPMAGWMFGATCTAIAFAAVVMFGLWLIERRWQSRRALVADIGGAVLIGVGLFWFVSRLSS